MLNLEDLDDLGRRGTKAARMAARATQTTTAETLVAPGAPVAASAQQAAMVARQATGANYDAIRSKARLERHTLIGVNAIKNSGAEPTDMAIDFTAREIARQTRPEKRPRWRS